MLETKRELERRIAEGRTAPEPAPELLPVDQIELCEDVFQHRRVSREYSAYFAAGLARSFQQQGSPLAPLLVFWVGDAWACVDGHHRIAAYRHAAYASGVPITVFKGTLDDAIAAAASGNTLDKLSMAPREKFNAAWRLSVGTDLSKVRISRAANVSEGTVAQMRRVLRALAGQLPRDELASMSWFEARKRFDGTPYSQDEGEAARDAQAEKLAARMRREFGQSLNVNPSILARALWLYNQRLPSQLALEFDQQLLVARDEDTLEPLNGAWGHAVDF